MSYSARERDAGHDVESQESVVRTYCEGGGNPVIALLLSPFVLVFNAVNAYLRPCVGSYASVVDEELLHGVLLFGRLHTV